MYRLSQTGSDRPPRQAGPLPAVDRLGIDLSSIEETLTMLRGLRHRYETHHHVPIGDEALRAAVELSDLYITDRSLLEWSADVLDDAAALVRSRTGGAPLNYREMLRSLENVQREKDAAISAQQFELAAEHHERMKTLRDEISAIEIGWLTEPIAGRPVVTVADIVETVSARSGVAARTISRYYRQLRGLDPSPD
jgi:ATP-dependent Clp protease ATP-binding subunit ClpC